jgi:hypothetical protein
MNHAAYATAHEPKSGGLLLLRRNTPLTRRAVAYFYSGAHNESPNDQHRTGNEDDCSASSPPAMSIENEKKVGLVPEERENGHELCERRQKA